MKIDKLKQLGFSPKLNSRKSVKIATIHLSRKSAKKNVHRVG